MEKIKLSKQDKERIARIIEAMEKTKYHSKRAITKAMNSVGYKITEGVVGGMINGKPPTINTVRWAGLAKVLNVSLDWLILGENSKSTEAELTKAIIQHWVDYSENWTIQ